MNLETSQLEIIRQNGVGHDIRCFILSRISHQSEDQMSLVNHYKYNDTNQILKIELSKDHLQIHEKNLIAYPNCQFLIKKGDTVKSITIRLSCKLVQIKNYHIFIRIIKTIP
jgi:hypothetical protein